MVRDGSFAMDGSFEIYRARWIVRDLSLRWIVRDVANDKVRDGYIVREVSFLMDGSFAICRSRWIDPSR